MIQKTGILLLSFTVLSSMQVDYTTMAMNDFEAVVNKYRETQRYRISYTYSRYNEDQFIESTQGENVRYNNFYYASFDSTVNLSTNTRSLEINHRYKVMTYKYGYASAGHSSRMERMLGNISGTLKNALSIEYEEVDLERGKYTLLQSEGNTWKTEYLINKVNHFIEQATFYNYYPDHDFKEVVKVDYQMHKGRVRLKDRKYDFNHYIRELQEGIELSESYSGYTLQSLKVKA